MRCDRCGYHIPRAGVVFDTKSKSPYAVGPYGAPTETVLIAIWRTCADQRDRLEKALWVGFLAILGGGLLALQSIL
jgi:hypothetical protein